MNNSARSGAELSRPPAAPAASGPRRRPLVLLLVAILLVAGIASAGVWWWNARQFESTDDAFIATHMVRVAPQVAGRVARVPVDDNQAVTPGEVVLEIDPATLQAKLDQAVANQANAAAALVQAKAQQTVIQANAEQARAEVGVAEADAANAATQFKRDQVLVTAGTVSRQQFDTAAAAARSTAANLTAVQKKQDSAEAQLAVAAGQIAAAEASVKSAAAQVEQARLDLSYATIVAPEAGHLANKNVAPGDYVQVGQNLMALVPLDIWVTANFKETQVDLMRVGQPVEIHVDAYPDKVFHGHIASFQYGSGAAFSLLPPENATGNYVKVVQRVPIKIVFDDPPDPSRPLGPGMSVVPRVKVR